ncbi:MAG: hypothetical protein H6732_15955 [Alphaproteobacteria bacterium]|nr:hypothetical protein [Alphaproteobacteria bacterium]
MPSAPRWHWPVWCRYLPSDERLLERADHVFEMVADVDGPPDEVLETLWNGSLKSGIPGFLGMIWSTPPDVLPDARLDECFVFMTLRLHTVATGPGSRVVVSGMGCTWPMAEQLVELCEAIPRDGRTHFVWRIGVLYPWWLAPAAPLIQPAFQWLFDTSLAALVDAYHQSHGRRAGAA